MELLNKNNSTDFNFRNINGLLKLSLVDKEIRSRNMCEPGINVQKYPEKISPYDYLGK